MPLWVLFPLSTAGTQILYVVTRKSDAFANLAEIVVSGDINAIWGRVSQDQQECSARLEDTEALSQHFEHIVEIASDHNIIALLAAFYQTLLSHFADLRPQFSSNVGHSSKQILTE